MEGLALLKTLIESTGLPPEMVERELLRLLATQGLEPQSLSLDEIREVLGQYLQEVLREAKDLSLNSLERS